ncbi:MAG: zinc ribbon domain-containing protein [Armatimonadetes bacterium]|nr:zinc ribbon domain-containing protein [Armatimonadota bacterium]
MSEEPKKDEQEQTEDDGAAYERRTCYRCGAELPEGAQRCPQCGRRQTRLCYCGHSIPVTAPKCPYCGADWSTALRVRRKSRSSSWNWRLLVAYSAGGALLTIALAAITNSVVGGLALRSLPPGRTGLPASFSARLSLAMTTIGRAAGHLYGKLAYLGGGPWVALTVAGTGALVGAVIYLRRAGALRLRWPFSKRRVQRRRRRGVY